MPRELSDLLHDTADRPSEPLDVGAIRGRARRRRVLRRGSGTAAAVAVLAVAVVLATGLSEPDSEVDLIDDPPAPDIEESDTDDADDTGDTDEAAEPEQSGEFGPELSTDDLRGLPQEGVAVEIDGQVVLLSLDAPAEVLGHVRGELAPYPDGLSSRGSGPLPLHLTRHQVSTWVDPATGISWEQLRRGTPVGADARVRRRVDRPPEERMVLLRDPSGFDSSGEPETLAAWPEDAPWWLTPDHRVVSWATCADGDCAHHYYDSATGDEGELDPGCWVGAADDDGFTQVCDPPDGESARGGRQLRVTAEPSATLDLPEGLDGEPTTATAVFGSGVIRADHATCDRVESFRIGDRELEFLGGDFRDGTSTAVPVGVAADGRIVRHSNASDQECGAQADQPGIRLHDPATGAKERMWDVEVPADAVRMWSSPGLRAADASQSAEDAERDSVVPELAALPLNLRVDQAAPDREQGRADTPEGIWLAARPDADASEVTDGCGLGDPDGVYGRDIICVMEYGEVVLLDEGGQRVERALPLPGVPPQWIEVTDEAVYCGRQGDGGLPTSMLCRVDRETGEATVRVFTRDREADEAYLDAMGEFLDEAGWALDDSRPGVRFDGMTQTAEGLVLEGQDGRALVDPQTLELRLDP